ncbi:MAG: hypothetical protein U5R48_18100 [Gammaproteobacteria bacterium]|nr:hypothetical protein [Gammaproteobacteria bacterium]
MKAGDEALGDLRRAAVAAQADGSGVDVALDVLVRQVVIVLAG